MHFKDDGVEITYTEIAISALASLFIYIVYMLWDIDSTRKKLSEKTQQQVKKQIEKQINEKIQSMKNKNEENTNNHNSISTNKKTLKMIDNKVFDLKELKESDDDDSSISSSSSSSESIDTLIKKKNKNQTIVDNSIDHNSISNVNAAAANISSGVGSCGGGGCIFNPSKIISDGKNKQKGSLFKLPNVSPLGTISLEELNKYHCNSDRQCLSILGTIYDVTHAKYKYGPEGSYKSFAGHDITLALGSGKLDEKWLDKFVKYPSKYISSAKGWMELYDKQYPKCGKLDVFEKKDNSKWPQLTTQEREELDKECILM